MVPHVGVEPTRPKALVLETSVAAVTPLQLKMSVAGVEPASPKTLGSKPSAVANFAIPTYLNTTTDS